MNSELRVFRSLEECVPKIGGDWQTEEGRRSHLSSIGQLRHGWKRYFQIHISVELYVMRHSSWPQYL